MEFTKTYEKMLYAGFNHAQADVLIDAMQELQAEARTEACRQVNLPQERRVPSTSSVGTGSFGTRTLHTKREMVHFYATVVLITVSAWFGTQVLVNIMHDLVTR
jgi:hypothetical protein